VRDVPISFDVIDEAEEDGLILEPPVMLLPRNPPNSSTSPLPSGWRLLDLLLEVLLEEKTVFIRPMIAELPELDLLPIFGREGVSGEG
jgi:hypothetical protein